MVMPEGTFSPEARDMRALMLGLVALFLGAIYGFSVGTAFVPGAEILAGVVTGICGAALTLLFWSILTFLPVHKRVSRMLRAALAMMLAMPVSVYAATFLVLTVQDPRTSWQKLSDVMELGLFMVRFSVAHLGFITLPVSALAGAATVAR